MTTINSDTKVDKRKSPTAAYFNYEGYVFGKLTVVSEAEKRISKIGNTIRMVNVVCSCGTNKKICLKNLVGCVTVSCGCQKVKDLKIKIGDKYGRLTILKDAGWDDFGKGKSSRKVTAICDCGVTKDYHTKHIICGNTVSCGCYLLEQQTKHGMATTRFYRIWAGILSRCNNPKRKNYKDYGGRGIKCEFVSFDQFKEAMFDSYKDGLTIDRIDVDGNYAIGNVKWSTYKEQGYNKRNTVWIDGMCLVDFLKKHRISVSMVRNRLRNGATLSDAIMIPKKNIGNVRRV